MADTSTAMQRDSHSGDSEMAVRWLADFAAALSERNRSALEDLLLPDVGWRDLAALTWNLRQTQDRDSFIELILAVAADIEPTGFERDHERPEPRCLTEAGDREIEVFFVFTTAAGKATGLATLVEDSETVGRLRAQTLLTRLVSLHGVEPVWPQAGRFDLQHPSGRWAEHVAGVQSFTDREPEVLVVGGGQFGVMTAAHLARLGVDTLIIDKHPRVGDAWRSRYESLILHQPHTILFFPFMPFPESFPSYIPKDKIADWFEAYVSMLDLNFWTSTEFLDATFDEASHEWTVSVRRGDGTVRVLHPKHVVIATGGSNIPNIPELPELESFTGETLHAGEFKDGAHYADKDVLIIGVGTSAHDYALDIAKHGGTATLAQRSPLIVVDLLTANELYGDYNGRDVPTEWIDERFMAGSVFPQQRRAFVEFQGWADEQDQELHAKLTAAGLRIWPGEDSTGFYGSFLQTQGGFYLNVGASDAIISGHIRILQLDEVERFVPDGVELADGSRRKFDTVIYATAYRPALEGIERDFGPEVAAKVGPIWGFGCDGELRNVYKPTGQEGLWIMMGSIPQARWYSPLVALMIKAEIDGIVPAAFKQDGHPSRTPKVDSPAVAATRRAPKALLAKQHSTRPQLTHGGSCRADNGPLGSH